MIVNNGQWWLPADRGRAATGNLTNIEDGSLRLELDRRIIPWTEQLHVVWGETADGTPVTLLGVQPYGTTTDEKIHVRVALIGIHLASADDAVFIQETVSLTNLTEWARRGGDPALPSQVANPNDLGEQISLRRDGDDVQLVVESDEPRTWFGFDTTIQWFRDLLTLAGTADCRIEASVLSTVDGVPVQVRTKPALVIEHRWHPEFVLGTVGDDFISRWLSLRATLGMSGAVLFSLDYGGRGYIQNKLFSAASAAEGIHQVLRPGVPGIPDHEHQALTALIDAMSQKNARQWGLSVIRHNQPGFAKRMRLLADVPDTEAVDALLHNKKTWANWMNDARNAIGHSAWDGMEDIPREVIPALTYVTKTLLHLVIFAELGLSPEVQRSAATFSYRDRRQPYEDHFNPPKT